MDIRFAEIRTYTFADFRLLRLIHQLHPKGASTYTLAAYRGMERSQIDIDVARDGNSDRAPHAMRKKVRMETPQVSDAEALYLAERAASFKWGDRFHFIHAPQ